MTAAVVVDGGVVVAAVAADGVAAAGAVAVEAVAGVGTAGGVASSVLGDPVHPSQKTSLRAHKQSKTQTWQ